MDYTLYSLNANIPFTPLTDYLNNLSPDSKEYEDTQGTVNMLEEQTAVCTAATQSKLSFALRRALLASMCGFVFTGNSFLLIWHEEMAMREPI